MTKGQCPEDGRYFPTQKPAYWYFRLNGFLTMENFILHPDRKGPARTDADLYGVRFPHRKELAIRDDKPFEEKTKKPLFVLVEITRGECKLNGPWTDKDKKNVEYVFGAIGAFPEGVQKRVADALYEQNVYEDDSLEAWIVAVGKNPSQELQETRPKLPQLRLDDMLLFMYKRFDLYREAKKDHSQWDQCGQNLWNEFEKHTEPKAFADCILAKLT